ncbi:hypothetical protein C2S51_034276 [Perilla frutescens var. frutescens]|nr:hypothetical protein C2S51_034276 [Perilla frutescens var. frutescens]
MVKPKQRQSHGAPGKKYQNQGSPKADPPDDGDWMVVKKQRITIIIPPLPNKKLLVVPSAGEGQLQEKPRSTTNSQSPRKSNSQLQCPSANSASKQSVHELEKSKSSAEQGVQPSLEVHPSEPPNLNFEKPSSLSHRSTSDNPPLVSHREGNGIGPCNTPKGSKGIKIFAHNTSFLNQRMRAWYLEKKLKKAGGLENWLVSLGLTRFVKVFQRRRVSKFHLANLTMQKLKDMGTDPVGPRRKLMHAIDCLCEPHCFQHV